MTTTKQIVSCAGRWCYEDGTCHECREVVSFTLKASESSIYNASGMVIQPALLPDGWTVDVAMVRKPLPHERTIEVPVLREWKFCPACGASSSTDNWSGNEMEDHNCDPCERPCDECTCEERA